MNFIDMVNNKYKFLLYKYRVCEFVYYDDYALFLYERIAQENEEQYYWLIERDFKEYSDMQTGKEREVERNGI